MRWMIVSLVVPWFAFAALAQGNRELPLGTEPWGPDVFRARRAQLMSQMKGGVGLLLSADRIDYPAESRQDANFLYLTGLSDEAGAVVLVSPQEAKREVLYLSSAVPERDRWTGYRAMLPNRALEARIGFETIRRLDPVGSGALGATLSYRAHRWHDLHFFGPLVGYASDLPKVLDIYSKTTARVPGARTIDSTELVARMRMIKEPREIEKIARATDIAVLGHVEAMKRVRPGMREWELKQILEDTFRRNGSRRNAYGSIVGAGADGCVLHYPRDDRTIQDGELVLIDAGAEFDHYASGVTRTFPANGKFTPEQRQVYDAVLRAQQAAMDKIRPGVTWDELSDIASRVLADAGYYDYFIHGLGHPVGLEVHDINLPALPLAEGMVITMEPGVYIPSKGIGVRIEDMILVTKTGYKNLSERLPRTAEAVERLMAEGHR